MAIMRLNLMTVLDIPLDDPSDWYAKDFDEAAFILQSQVTSGQFGAEDLPESVKWQATVEVIE